MREEPLLLAIEHAPLLVKPNRSELAKTLGTLINDDDSLRTSMLMLQQMGAQWVLTTLGRAAAFLPMADRSGQFPGWRSNTSARSDQAMRLPRGWRRRFARGGCPRGVPPGDRVRSGQCDGSRRGPASDRRCKAARAAGACSKSVIQEYGYGNLIVARAPHPALPRSTRGGESPDVRKPIFHPPFPPLEGVSAVIGLAIKKLSFQRAGFRCYQPLEHENLAAHSQFTAAGTCN